MPLALIEASIVPLHGALALPQVDVVGALVTIARLPREHPLAMLHIGGELTLILVAVRPLVLFPFSSSMLEPVMEVADVGRAVAPPIMAETFGTAPSIVAGVGVTVGENVSTLAMLEGVEPLTLVAVPVLPLVHTEAINATMAPLTNVAVPLDTLPCAIAMFDLLLPFTVINLATGPGVNAFSMWLIVEKEAQVSAATAKDLKPLSVSAIVFPFTFVNVAVCVDEHAETVALTLRQDALVKGVLGSFDTKLFSVFDLVVVEKLRDHYVLV